MQQSMTALASLAIRARPNEYWKVVCVAGRERVSVVAEDQVTAPVPE
jgi:hypothetical protein